MLDVPVESTYIWLGLALVSAAMLGLAVRVPTAPPPDAGPVADTVDSVASSPYEAQGRHPIDAERIRLGSERIGLRNSAGTDHAAFAYDDIVPVFGSDALGAVVRGRPPATQFDNRSAFESALEGERTHEPAWQPAPEVLVVRRVEWGDVNATLVGA